MLDILQCANSQSESSKPECADMLVSLTLLTVALRFNM